MDFISKSDVNREIKNGESEVTAQILSLCPHRCVKCSAKPNFLLESRYPGNCVLRDSFISELQYGMFTMYPKSLSKPGISFP